MDKHLDETPKHRAMEVANHSMEAIKAMPDEDVDATHRALDRIAAGEPIYLTEYQAHIAYLALHMASSLIVAGKGGE